MSRREKLCILIRNLQSRQNSTIWNLVFILPLRMLLNPWTVSFKKDTITAKIVSKSTCLEERKKNEIHLANEESGLAFFRTDLGHFFGCIISNEPGVMLRRKGPHKPEFAYNPVRIPSLIRYVNLIQYIIVGNTKAPLLRCFLIGSKPKVGDILTTGQYMNYHIFSKLPFKPLLKNSVHRIHIDSRDTSGKQIRVVSVGITRLVLMFRKASNIYF